MRWLWLQCAFCATCPADSRGLRRRLLLRLLHRCRRCRLLQLARGLYNWEEEWDRCWWHKLQLWGMCFIVCWYFPFSYSWDERSYDLLVISCVIIPTLGSAEVEAFEVHILEAESDIQTPNQPQLELVSLSTMTNMPRMSIFGDRCRTTTIPPLTRISTLPTTSRREGRAGVDLGSRKRGSVVEESRMMRLKPGRKRPKGCLDRKVNAEDCNVT